VTYLRFDAADVYHAVLGYQTGMTVTYCGRFISESAVSDATSERPREVCRCCQARLDHPYLIPRELLSLPGVHAARASG
jgi:hypothetical protein